MTEIYALCEPVSGEVRYIGKATCSHRRFASHLRDARRRDTPVYRWIRKRVAAGAMPVCRVLRECAVDEWPGAERLAIAEARAAGARLLNVADGGNEPFCPPDVRAANGANNAKARVKDERSARIYRAKRYFGSLLAKGEVSEAIKEKLRYCAKKAPHLFGCWANV